MPEEIKQHEIAPPGIGEAADHWDQDPVSRMRRLEAVLFLSRKPLASRKISQLAHLEDGTQARTMINELNSRYDQAGRAFQIKKVAGGYQMLTRPQFSRLDSSAGTCAPTFAAVDTGDGNADRRRLPPTDHQSGNRSHSWRQLRRDVAPIAGNVTWSKLPEEAKNWVVPSCTRRQKIF